MTNNPLTEHKRQAIMDSLRPQQMIWWAYLSNELDGGARRFWGADGEFENQTNPKDIEIYQGRGGKQLLTLEDCRNAAAVMEMLRL